MMQGQIFGEMFRKALNYSSIWAIGMGLGCISVASAQDAVTFKVKYQPGQESRFSENKEIDEEEVEWHVELPEGIREHFSFSLNRDRQGMLNNDDINLADNLVHGSRTWALYGQYNDRVYFGRPKFVDRNGNWEYILNAQFWSSHPELAPAFAKFTNGFDIVARRVPPTHVRYFGGMGGDPKEFILPANWRITSIEVHSGTRVDFIKFTFANPAGQTGEWSAGGGGGVKHPPVKLDGDEYIKGIEGRSGSGIDHIAFVTNKRTIFGSPKEKVDFTNVLEGSELGALRIRSGDEINRIGVFFRPHNAGPKP